MDYRPLPSYDYDGDLEIVSYPHAVLVKRLVDRKHQLVTGSGEEQDPSTNQKAR